MHTNGTMIEGQHELTDAQRADVLARERTAILIERETLRIRYRVRKSIGASAESLREVEGGLEQCERALDELDVIAREWGAPEPNERPNI